jgi:hypothetical protein
MNAAGRSFLWATHYCGAQATYPEVVARRAGTHSRRTRRFAGSPSLFGLAPCGVCPARRITAAAVRSYRTFSPLPEPCGPGGMFSVALSVERSRLYKRGRPPGRYPAHCSAEFGLSSVLQQRPSGPAANRFIIVQVRNSSGFDIVPGPLRQIMSARLRFGFFGRQQERIHQQGQANQQRNHSGKINRFRDPQPR